MMDYQHFIAEGLGKAAAIAQEKFGNVSGTTKAEDNNQVLTDADLAIGKYLVGKVKEVYPEHNILDEEAGIVDNQSDYTWVIDPIDGTSNFANGVPMYGIMIGLLQGETPIAGGIALPSFKTICVAGKNKGALHNGKKLQVTQEQDLLHVLVSYCIDGHQENPSLTHEEVKLFGEIILKIRNLRTSNSAFDAVMIAEGRYGGLLNRTSKIWDNVAQQLLIEEAGGVYTDFFGKPIDYSNPLQRVKENYTFCAGAPALHKQLQDIIHQH